MPAITEFASLPTERPNPRSRGIDALPLERMLAVMAREDSGVARAVWARRRELARAAALLETRWRAGGNLIFVGAGTSGRLGVLEAAELPPTFGVPPRRVRALIAGGRSAVFKAVEGAEDDPLDGARSLRASARSKDAVVAIAASGVTAFVRGALAAARRMGCATVLITANSSVAGAADAVVAIGVGPEIVTGSTRLKAATASKMALNALTTAAMVRLGKVHDGWMVELSPANRKLRARAQRTVAALGRVSAARARALLARAGGQVKPAIVMARKDVPVAEARRRLARVQGSLRRVLEGA